MQLLVLTEKPYSLGGAVARCPTAPSSRHRAHGDMSLHATARPPKGIQEAKGCCSISRENGYLHGADQQR